ncbi:4123_t:CDS:2, partial [Cetraspora pellucida]
MSFPPFFDAEESTATPSNASTMSTMSHKKRKANARIAHSNKSHIRFFFRIDKNGNTSNMISYLHDKHNITKDNYIDHLDEHNKFVYVCEPGFQIPYNKTSKGLIHKAYNWSNDQLKSLINNSVMFQEALLSCDHRAYPHTEEIICKELIRLIHNWCLEATIFTVATNNRANMLSVKEGLKQCKAIHHHVKSLQAFFQLPKQAQCLHEKCVLELHNAIRFVLALLLSKPDCASQKEEENLEKLCLSVSKK